MVDRSHSFPPKDAPTCILCGDIGLNDHAGTWKFCLCEAGQELLKGDPEAAARAQEKLDRLEGLVR